MRVLKPMMIISGLVLALALVFIVMLATLTIATTTASQLPDVSNAISALFKLLAVTIVIAGSVFVITGVICEEL